MRYFVVHKDLYLTYENNKYPDLYPPKTIPLCIYEVNKPVRDANGRWKATPKVELTYYGSTVSDISKGWFELYHKKEMTGTSSDGNFEYWKENYHDLEVTDDGRLGVSTGNTSWTYNKKKKKKQSEKYSGGFKKFAGANEWEIGATVQGNNVGDNYCFYCKYGNDEYILLHSSDGNGMKEHNSSYHDGASGNNTSNSSGADYKNNSTTGGGSSLYNSSQAVSFTQGGTRGVYLDGQASTPYLMLELSAPGVSGSYNLSIPANNFVDLNHERNLSDSFNKFTLNLFDKDATEVESKLLLGFRNITFYYTDFVSESKRFTGEILNYQTVITGKGLMLTITGYTSNVRGMIGQDSIPWKTLCDANSYGFYYWSNKNGDFFGIVCRDEKGNVSNTGTPVPYPNPELNGTSQFFSYPGWNSTYKDVLTEEEWKLYTPESHIWALTDYNSNFKTIVGDSMQWSAKKPSDIVRAICAINGWLVGEIEETKSVSSIPDQINESATEYIKTRLIPLSESLKTGKAQYYFWFDDTGKANFRTGYGYTETPKTLYFNAGKDKPDSYPLVGFTAATNGAILMLKDASNYMDSVNVYTGDPLSSEIERDEKSIKSIGTTSDWFSTNKITSRNSAFRSKITYEASSSIPSQTELNTKLKARYDLVAQYPYQAELQVRGCTDISPGDSVKVVIYLDESIRNVISDGMHHTSGTYFINKIVDTIAGGKFISTMTCLKLGDLENYGTVVYDNSSDFGVEEKVSSEEGSR